eukprot:jgi/Mesen1/7394/ME000388S06609
MATMASVLTAAVKPRCMTSSTGELMGSLGGLSKSASPSTVSFRAHTTVSPMAMSRVCDLTGRRRNNGYNVSFSMHKTKKVQEVNLQKKRLWWEEGNRFVKLKISCKALKTVELKGLSQVAKEHGVDLSKF